MASVKTKDIQDAGLFMQEFWNFVKDFWIPEESEEYWRGVVARVDELTEKYPSVFCGRMCMAFVEHLEKEDLKRRGISNG